MQDVIITKISDDVIAKRRIMNWPIWEKEVSRFDWEYDGDEECLVLEGEVEVMTGNGRYILREGDFVTFRKGLKCTWNVKKPIRKHYNFP